VLEGRARTVACIAAGGGLIAVGTLGTGVLPSSLPYQLLAGATIVAGFAVVYACIGAFDAFDLE
jgi:hypothetical protein